MMKSAYPFSLSTAIILSALLFSGCAGGQKKETLHLEPASDSKADAASRLEQEFIAELSPIVTQLAGQAGEENPDTLSLEQLLSFSRDPSLPAATRGQAALLHAKLLFAFERPDAFTSMERILKQWPEHPDTPATYLFLAQRWLELGYPEEALDVLTDALHLPALTADLIRENSSIAETILGSVSKNSALEWLLTASKADSANREQWLQQAAKLSSLEYALQLRHSDKALTAEQSNFYRYLAKQRLMVGDYHAVRLIVKILETDMPESDAKAVVSDWLTNKGVQSSIGILLPLSGKYAKYGQQALEGIRLALNQPEFEDTVTIHIYDTKGSANDTITGYQQLTVQGAEWIIGPLLSTNTEALLPHLQDDIPVIALSNQVELAAHSPSLFIHSLAKTVQADFMAQYALQHQKQRMLIIHDHLNSTREEAAAFAQTFIDNGGEIVDVIELEEGVSDNRPGLVAMRSRTDDEVLLAALESELQLFSPELEMDIILPLEFDAIYIAASGQKLSLLAGQMAYSDISRIQLYGSFRWFDGHLLDDKGRYLNNAQFATPFTSLAQPEQAILDVQNQYRVIWAEGETISPLFALAYDAAINIASLGTRLGLKEEDAIEALNSTDFNGISGNYYFDSKGISQKSFAIQTIRQGRIETVQQMK